MNEKQDDIRVVVVDDHLVVREGLRMMLEIAGEGFVLLGDAADGATAVRMIEELQPDVVLMDLRMPGMDGLEAITQIREHWPHIAIVILTTYGEDDFMLRGLRAGACGYLLKDVDCETLFQAIRAAARGDLLLQSETMARILARTTDAPHPMLSEPQAERDTKLTEREREVLEAIARGERSKEIASRLGISLRTVGSHITSIYMKLGVDSRASAVAVGIERGLLSR